MHKKKVAWRCRRGIKEVEMVLLPFFEQCYESLSDDQKALFWALLECEDTDLFAWFTTRSRPDRPALSAFVDELLAFA